VKGKFWKKKKIKYLNGLCKLLQCLKSLMWNNTKKWNVFFLDFLNLNVINFFIFNISQSYEYTRLDSL